MNYRESVHFLYSLGNEIHTAKLGLDRIRTLLNALDQPQRACRFIHVAGTNGKGSTCAMIEAGLRAAGIRTGLYTSPHLSEPTERISIAGEAIGEEQFAAAFTEVHAVAERIGLDMHPTYFETVTAMAFVVFRAARVDTVVLEVGLGGRLDATNVVEPQLCVITPIDFDHQVFLGDSIQQIASEKAGILKPAVPAVFASQREEAAEVLRAHANGPYTFTDEWPLEDVEVDRDGSRFVVRGVGRVSCPLAGEHQVENARAAAVALDRLGCPADGIAGARWPGRLERIRERPDIVLDGAHNLAGTRALAAYIRRFYAGRRIRIVYGVMRDKAVEEMTAILFPLADRIILTTPDNLRAMPPENIPATGAMVTHSVAEAVRLLDDAAPDEVVFITGSLFVVGEARALLVQ